MNLAHSEEQSFLFTIPTVGETLRTIYALRLRSLRNMAAHMPRGRVIGWVVVAVVVLLVASTIYRVAPLSLKLSAAGAGAGDKARLATALVSCFNVAFAMLFLASFPVALGTFTYKSDLAILLPMPLPNGVVFVEKLMTATLRQYLLAVPLLTPYLLGVGAALHVAFGYYLVTALLLLVLPIIPTCLGAIVSFFFLSIFPPAQAKGLVTVGGALVGSAFYLTQEIIWSSRASVNLGQAVSVLRHVPITWLTVLPPSWPAVALNAVLAGDSLQAMVVAIGLIVLNVAAFLAAVTTARHAFSAGWANYQETGRVRAPRRSGQSRLLLRVGDWLPTINSQGVVAKEWLVFCRDPQQWAALIMPLGVSVYFSYFLVYRLNDGQTSDGLRFLLTFAGLNFLISSLCAPLSLTIVNREGHGFYLLRTAPLTARTILREKFIALFLPLTLVFEALMLFIDVTLHLQVVDALMAGLGAALVTASLICWSMILSLMFPRLNWTNIIEMTTWQAWLLSFVGGGSVGLIEGLFVALGPLAASSPAPWVAPYAFAIGIAMSLLTTGVLLFGVFVWGAKKMATWDIRF